MTTHISIDIETPSTKRNAAIMQIGVATMDHAGNILPELGLNLKIDITDYDRYPQFHVHMDTMLWWAKQDAQVRNDVFGAYNPSGVEGVNEDRLPIESALRLFVDHINQVEGKIRIWAKPPSFDLVIIQHALDQFDLKYPWHFRDERCVRTLLSLTPKDTSIHGMPIEGSKHNAYDDALHQLKQIRECLLVAGRIR